MLESLRHIWQEVAPNVPVDLLGQTAVVAGAACAMAVGILMLIWARLLGRALLALVGVGIGLALGPAVADLVGVDVLIGRVALAAVLGIVALVLARGVWALLLAALAGALTASAVILHHLQWVPADDLPQLRSPETLDWPHVGQAAMDYFWGMGQAVYDRHGALLGAAVTGAVVIGLAVGVLLPTLSTILVASLLGALLVVIGSQVLFLGAGGQLFPPSMGNPVVALSAIGVLMLAGLIVQGLSARKARRTEKKKEKASADGDGDIDDDGDGDDGDD
jgi:hypothetical protein